MWFMNFLFYPLVPLMHFWSWKSDGVFIDDGGRWGFGDWAMVSQGGVECSGNEVLDGEMEGA
jgi:hypothetical protein